MSARFHLAIAVSSIEEARLFYCDFLGCEPGNFEEGKWQDINFWGNELTLHAAQHQGEIKSSQRHHVDMGKVCVPHFGIHLNWDVFSTVKKNVEKQVGFLDEPYIRFAGLPTQQETFFVEDPNFNVIEIKSIQGSYYEQVKAKE